MKEINKEQLIDAIDSAVNYLVYNKEKVNELNVFPVPDGDTGTNMSMTVQSALKQLKSSEPKTAGEVAQLASRGALMGARGNSGVILSQLFRGFAEGVKDLEVINVQSLALACKKASEMTYLAVMKPTEGTILTVGREAADYGLKIARKHKDIVEFSKEVLSAAKRSLDNTPNLLPVLKEAGVVDAGGMGLVVILEGVLFAFEGKKFQAEDSIDKFHVEDISLKKDTLASEDIKFGYCTEFMVTSKKDEVESLKKELTKLGDSLLVVGDDNLIKVHLHTNDPGIALQKGLEIGPLKDIKIDNMRLQHKEILFSEKQISEAKKEDSTNDELNFNAEEKEFGFVAISSGEGISALFKDLGVDYIVTGGQTMNPSTEDILEGINKINAKNVFILPNNSNIILAAETAKDIAECNVSVINTKTIPEGVAAVLAFNGSNDFAENEKRMAEAIQEIKSAQVTYAVRDTEMNGKNIKKDDFIGISEKEIISSGKNLLDVTFEMIENLVDEDTTLITLYSGKETSEDDIEKIREKVEETFQEIDLEIIDGQQPIYYYLVSVE